MTCATSSALADQTARLVYVRAIGAEECPDEDELRMAVQSRLGYDPFRPLAALTVVATVARKDGRYRGEMLLVGEHGDEVGKRILDLQSARCADLIGALALTVSIAIDPLVLMAGPRSMSPRLPPEDAGAATADANETTARAAPGERRPAPPQLDVAPAAPPGIQPFVGGALVGILGASPQPSLGAEVFGGVRRGPFALQIEARATLPTSSVDGGVTVSSFFLTGGLAPCGHVSILFGCAVVWAGMVTGSTSDIASPRTARAPYVALGPRLGVDVPLGDRVRGTIALELGLPIVRYPLAVNHDDVVYSPPPVWGALRLGLSYR